MTEETPINIDNNGGLRKMNVNGIGAGYPAAGYETRRARRNYADKMCNMVPATQSSGGTFELHISNDKDGKAIGSMCGADYSLTVYQPKDFDLQTRYIR